MAKKRKTRKDKQQADQRHPKVNQISSFAAASSPQPGVYTYNPSSTSSAKTTDKKIFVQETHQNSATAIIYQYAMQDIRKTAFITFAIVLAQIVVYVIGTHARVF
jgi:hypothetical protein